MSIIQEALKRAQYDYASKKSLPQARKEPEQKPVILAPAKAPDARAIKKKIAFIVYVIVLLSLVTGFGIKVLFSKIVSIDKEKKSKNSIVDSRKKDPAKEAPPLPSPVTAVVGQANQSADFVLNGIMYIKERAKAIINGTVVRVGDVISGAVVTAITEKNVLLKYNNNDNQVEVSLKLKE